LTALLILCQGSIYGIKNNKVYVVFRFDDYGITDNRFNVKLLDTFTQARVPLCIGVVPSKSNRDDLDQIMLKDYEIAVMNRYLKHGAIEIALHGYNHGINSGGAYDTSSEFYGLPFKEQLLRIERGKEYLSTLFDKKIDVFIPPFNSYDQTTLAALEQAKFHIISAASVSSKNGVSKTLLSYPVSTDLFTLEKAVKHAMKSRENKVIVCVIHDYDFISNSRQLYTRGKKLSFNDLSSMLERISKESNVKIMTFDEIALEHPIRMHNLPTAGPFKDKLVPSFISGAIHPYYIVETRSQRLSHNLMTFVLAALIRVLMVFAGFACFILVRRYVSRVIALNVAVLILTMVTAFSLVHDTTIGWRLHLMIMFNLGVIIGNIRHMIVSRTSIQGKWPCK